MHRLKQKWSFRVAVILLWHDLCLYCLLSSHHGMDLLGRIPVSMHWAWIFRAAIRPLMFCETLKQFKCLLETRECIVNVPKGKGRAGSQAQPVVLGTSGSISPLYQVGMLGRAIWTGTNTAAAPTFWMGLNWAKSPSLILPEKKKVRGEEELKCMGASQSKGKAVVPPQLELPPEEIRAISVTTKYKS